MRVVRRITAALIGLAMLHLGAARADAACAAHDMSHPLSSQMPGHDMQHSNDSPPNSSCETPAQAQCCQVLASCSVVFAASADSPIPAAAAVKAAAFIVGPERPISLSTAPEPPPPRA